MPGSSYSGASFAVQLAPASFWPLPFSLPGGGFAAAFAGAFATCWHSVLLPVRELVTGLWSETGCGATPAGRVDSQLLPLCAALTGVGRVIGVLLAPPPAIWRVSAF